MRVVRELITPDRASELLMLNTENRAVRDMLVARYANDILNGYWNNDTGETIKINKDNKLVDGQHRLHAVIKAGRSMYLDIAYDVSNHAFQVIDSGLRRQPKDVLHIIGASNSTRLAAMITKYYFLKKGHSSKGQTKTAITHSQVLEMYNANPDILDDTVMQAANWYNGCNQILPPATIGAYYLVFRDINEEDAYNFWNELCSRAGGKSDAISLLKDKLIQDKISNRKMLPGYKHALIIKAWNYYRQNVRVKSLRIRDGEQAQRPI